MIYILVGAIVMVVLTVIFFWLGQIGNSAAGDLGIITGIISIPAIIIVVASGWNWHKAGYKAQVINREFETNYTQAEVFYADDVIDEIRQMNRQRIEINGNVMFGGNCKNE